MDKISEWELDYKPNDPESYYFRGRCPNCHTIQAIDKSLDKWYCEGLYNGDRYKKNGSCNYGQRPISEYIIGVCKKSKELMPL